MKESIVRLRALEKQRFAYRYALNVVDFDAETVAPGGSAVCREKAAEHLKSLGPVVYLKVPLEELSGRIQNLSTRGIAMQPGQTLADVMAYRAPLYDKYADLVIDCGGGQTLAQSARLVLERLRELSR